jgi:hypothetical protein
MDSIALIYNNCDFWSSFRREVESHYFIKVAEMWLRWKLGRVHAQQKLAPIE